MSRRVLFLLLDAFRGDYINPIDTPFLDELSRKGTFAPKLKSVAGFTQRTAIYSGTTGEKSGMFTMYTFDPANSPFRFLRDDPRLKELTREQYWWDRLPSVRGLGRLKYQLHHRLVREPRAQFIDEIRREAKKYADNATISDIPLFMLPEIGISEDMKPIYLPGALEVETIFDVFVREKVSYKYLMYPVVNIEDDAVMDAFIQDAGTGARILLGQFSDSDFLVHKCGPSSPDRRKVTGEIDRKLREIHAHFGDDVLWIIIGDHGMADVKEELDIPALLRPLEQRTSAVHGRDYLVFLDSTMARFLWKTDRGRQLEQEVRKHDALLQKGRFIDQTLADKYKIPTGDRRYGDLIWWADVGVLLFPDYFHDTWTHNRGMHGYASDHDDMKGFFLAYGPGISTNRMEEVELVDVCATLCGSVGVRPPRENHGRNLIA